jgi:sterol 24-C-methyltransferase
MTSVKSVYEDSNKMKDVQQSINKYTAKYADQESSTLLTPMNKDEVAKNRFKHASSMTAAYFDLTTDFYEYGYGQCFHFAPIYDGKPFEECLADYEREAGKMIGAKPGMKILVSH